MSSDLAIFGGNPVRERPFPDWPRVTDELKHSLINTLENEKWGNDLLSSAKVWKDEIDKNFSY